MSGFLLIISGPSGVGKSTITNEIVKRLEASLSVSMTTRPQTADDVEGEHYFFVDQPTFERHVAGENFLEHATYAGNCYGTPRKPVQDQLDAGRVVVLEIDVAGARQVKSMMPEAYAIFVEAPTKEALLERLRRRKREDEEQIQRRFGIAQREIEFAKGSDIYDAFIVNDDLDRAIVEVEQLVRRRLGQPADQG